MAKYHITKAGKPAKCNATEKACPLGGDHYDSPQDAAVVLMEADIQVDHMAERLDSYLEEHERPTFDGTSWDSYTEDVRQQWFHYQSSSEFVAEVLRALAVGNTQSVLDDWLSRRQELRQSFGQSFEAFLSSRDPEA